MKPRISFWTLAETFPPVLVRLLARHKAGPPFSDEEIALASGLGLHQVYCLSRSTTWAGTDLPTMRSFLLACGVDFEDRTRMKAVRTYLIAGSTVRAKGKILRKAPTFKYLRTSPNWMEIYQPLIKLWMHSHQTKQQQNNQAPSTRH